MTREGPVGFDLDLTLIDSRATILDSFAETARSTGVAIDLEAVAARMGLKLEDELAYWFESAAIAEAADRYRAHYLVLAASSTPVMPGAAAALRAVASYGERTVIVTAKHPSTVGACLLAAGLQADQVFAHVHGPEKGAVLAEIGASAYVGDTPADMAAALAVGVYPVGVATGSFDEATLRDAGAAVVFDTLLEFPGWFMGFRAGATPNG